jgi:hypothetical protein
MVSIHRGVAPDLRDRVMHECWLAGVWKALWFGLTRMLTVLCEKLLESSLKLDSLGAL